MMWKLIISIAFVGFISAIEIHHSPLYKGYVAPALIKAAPIGVKTYGVEEGPAEYEFSYSVHDPHTGDIKSQKESRKGHAVEGSYELIDSDGHRRIVQYSADEHSGFNAIVHREPTDIKIPVPEHKIVAAHKIIAPKILAAPVVHYAHQPTANHQHELHGGNTHVSFVGPAVSYHY